MPKFINILAPEVLLGESYGLKADLFSLGVISF
jgi:serine/threonine protein kinase